jgi:hypothetical protein
MSIRNGRVRRGWIVVTLSVTLLSVFGLLHTQDGMTEGLNNQMTIVETAKKQMIVDG